MPSGGALLVGPGRPYQYCMLQMTRKPHQGFTGREEKEKQPYCMTLPTDWRTFDSINLNSRLLIIAPAFVTNKHATCQSVCRINKEFDKLLQPDYTITGTK